MLNKKAQAGWLILIIVVLLGGGLLFKFWLGPKIFITQVDTAHDIVEKTYTADNAINNYEWFKTQHEKIIATEKQIDNTQDELTDYKEMYGDPNEWEWNQQEAYAQMRTTFLGQKNHYEDLVAEYNARSEMQTRSVFKDKLPYNIDKKIW